MKKHMHIKKGGMLDDILYRRRWKKTTAFLGIFVVLYTLFALMLPAITLDRAACGLEEHTHGAVCYAEPRLICSLAEIAGHAHADDCYAVVVDPEGDPGHKHDDACYAAEDSYANCTLAETEGHTHTDACYKTVLDPEGDPGHIHTDICYAAEDSYVCGLEVVLPHAHDAACYKVIDPGHKHDDACYAAEESYICGLAETKGHAHDDACYTVEGYTCGEKADDPLHVHDDLCPIKALTCTLEEAEGHTHDEQCGVIRVGDLICQTPEAEPTKDLLCTLEETEGHTHDDKCGLTEKGTLVCTEEEREPAMRRDLLCTLEEAEGHTHDDKCGLIEKGTLVCTEEEREPATMQALVCTLEEREPHTHTEPCYDTEKRLTCTLIAHTHTEDCFPKSNLTDDQQREVDDAILVIGALTPLDTFDTLEGDFRTKALNSVKLAVETYDALSEEQKAAVTNAAALTPYRALLAEPAANTLSVGGGLDDALDVTLTLDYSLEAGLPFGTNLEVAPITFDKRAYVRNSEDIDLLFDDTPRNVLGMYDISLTFAGKSLEPKAEVTVSVTFDEPLETRSTCFVAVHFADDGATELLPVDAVRDQLGRVVGFTHTQRHFSPVAYVEISPIENATEIGTDWLPITYWVYHDGEWVVAGSTRTGWYGDPDKSPSDSYDPDMRDRDCITLEQLQSVYSKYGFDANDYAVGTVSPHLWYQRLELQDRAAHCDTSPYTKAVVDPDNNTVNKNVFPLARNAVSSSGYYVYYLPGNTATSPNKYANADFPANMLMESEFHTVIVQDANNVVYAANEARPEAKFVLYGKSVSFAVKPFSNGWQWFGEAGIASKAENGVEGADGLITYTRENIREKTVLMPIGNAMPSGMVQKTQKVYIMVYLDDEWQQAGETDVIFKQDNFLNRSGEGKERWFITSNQLYTILAPYGFESDGYTYPLRNPDGTYYTINGAYPTNTFAHQVGAPHTGAVYTDAESDLLLDGKTWAIGLSYDQQDYTLYYLPTYTGRVINGNNPGPDGTNNRSTLTAIAKQPENAQSCFYTISVRDRNQLIYAVNESAALSTIVRKGDTGTITVATANHVLWSSEPERAGSVGIDSITFTFPNVSTPCELVATHVNPNYTVQYYGRLLRYDLHNAATTNSIPLIDTTGGKLPQNGNADTQKLLYLDLSKNTEGLTAGTQNSANQNEPLYRVGATETIEELYRSHNFSYAFSPSSRFVDVLYGRQTYRLAEFWVLKQYHDPNSVNENDWWIYEARSETGTVNGETVEVFGNNITFTNNGALEYAPRVEGVKQPSSGDYVILLEENTVVRLVYEAVTTEDVKYDVAFYDYDISNGVRTEYPDAKPNYAKWQVGSRGINSPGNYSSETTWGNLHKNPAEPNWPTRNQSTLNVYGFGNENCSTGLGLATWNGNYLNKSNSYTDGTGDNKVTHMLAYKGCTFGLVSGLDKNGKLIWSTNVNAPVNLFGGNSATGKSIYQYNNAAKTESAYLGFKQIGDTYTLTNASSVAGSRQNLNYFFHPSPKDNTIYDHIYTNNFWVVDNAPNKTDPLFGKTGTQIFVNGYHQIKNMCETVNGNGKNENPYLPQSDDGRNHNSFFGMSFSLDFSVDPDYVGPLEYIFFGDDDMWVFLTDKRTGESTLICDIGGVHSAVGEYVNLRDYIPVKSDDEALRAVTEHYTLSFFYTERGASGSTCWMSFTLPSPRNEQTIRETGTLTFSKELKDAGAGEILDHDSAFEFEIRLFEPVYDTEGNVIEDMRGDELEDQYTAIYYHRLYNKNGEWLEDLNGNPVYTTHQMYVWSGANFYLYAGDKVLIKDMPVGAQYTITETANSAAGYTLSVDGKIYPDYTFNGVIKGETTIAGLTNHRTTSLPSTGGCGTEPFTYGGLALIGAAVLMFVKTRKREGDGSG